jgi:hypothetical protein
MYTNENGFREYIEQDEFDKARKSLDNSNNEYKKLYGENHPKIYHVQELINECDKKEQDKNT